MLIEAAEAVEQQNNAVGEGQESPDNIQFQSKGDVGEELLIKAGNEAGNC